ncbi:MAG: indole-3-glycerol phosphate synthase TrpC [Alphaproteobacteria bacterium]|nr:indole-3-glycerol phosphate synthase TrpC [Alphaproteobacteria bacterium]
MSDILARICATTRETLTHRQASISLKILAEQARNAAPPRGFASALERMVTSGNPALIAEIKKASPSAGIIRPDFNPAALAKAYAAGGAACLSVLTDEPYFQGCNEFLVEASAACALPVLRKDFMLDPYQIVESRAIGADCILLILAALTDSQAAEMEATAQEQGLDVLIEVHDEAELERAMRLASPLIGVNNRNLKTLSTDLGVTERLAPLVPPGRVLVAESGLHHAADLARLARVGARRFLVGESLMRQDDVEGATRSLLGGLRAW